MAVLGYQVVLTLVAASVLQKLLPRWSFADWLLRGLQRYVCPSQRDLKAAADGNLDANGKQGTKNQKSRNQSDDLDSLTFLKSTSITLDSSVASRLEVLQLPYYNDFRWSIDLTCMSVLVYSISELCRFFLEKEAASFNLSLIWLTLTGVCAVKALLVSSALHFRAAGGERSLCLCVGFLCFLLTMVTFLFSEHVIDVPVIGAFERILANSVFYFQSQNIETRPPASRSPIPMCITMSALFGCLGVSITFPCLRYARSFIDCSDYYTARAFTRLIQYSTFALQCAIPLLWTRDLGGSLELTQDQLEILRVVTVLVWCMLRFMCVRQHLQLYLDLAQQKAESLRNEAGRISATEYRSMINGVFLYMCVVAIQLLAPVVLIGVTALLYKSLAGVKWLNVIGMEQPEPDRLVPLVANESDFAKLMNIFDTTVCRGFVGFSLFWLNVTCVILNCCSVAYYSRIAD